VWSRRSAKAEPADTVEGLAELYRFRDFAHFIEVWVMTTAALQTAADYRQIVVDYAAEAAAHGAVYIEGIFSPARPAADGSSWEEIFEGYCDGAQEARELHGVEVRLIPDIPRGFPLEAAEETARMAIAYRERGVLGLGLGGPEAEFPPELYAPAFDLGRDGGLASVPHAGEVAGVDSIRGALEALGADRIRHGIRAVEDPALVRELADHPLPTLVEAGIPCSLSTDDPAMFGTDLGREYDVATEMGLPAQGFFDAGVEGALCDEETKDVLRRLGAAYEWPAG
jgi:aminodeoxyfutalosine deaminase